MCGIIGFTGVIPAKDVIINGLEQLEYRGYDSAGVALLSDGDIVLRKRTGKVAELKKLCEAEVVLVRSLKAFDHTNLLTMRVPKEYAMKARFFTKD